jgi:hypothetical protein
VTQSKQATFNQLTQVVAQASHAPFAADLLEVDESLWGGFWQGDVMAPGYLLPAVELALLRAIRLDAAWPEGTTAASFLADLHAAILDPQAGVWAVMVAGEPCVIFASPGRWRSDVSHQPSATVVWYCATTRQLHAGYRTAGGSLNFTGAVEQRPLKDLDPMFPIGQQSALTSEQTLNQADPSGGQDLATRLDVEILRIRQRG